MFLNRVLIQEVNLKGMDKLWGESHKGDMTMKIIEHELLPMQI